MSRRYVAGGVESSKRRPLGDITNAGVDASESRDTVIKRPGQAAQPLPAVQRAKEIIDDRVYMQRPSDDIDARDAGNPILVSSYVNEMYDCFGELERQYMVNSNYMSSQPYINDKMRSILMDWLVSHS